jgi:hypothetical protein
MPYSSLLFSFEADATVTAGSTLVYVLGYIFGRPPRQLPRYGDEAGTSVLAEGLFRHIGVRHVSWWLFQCCYVTQLQHLDAFHPS